MLLLESMGCSKFVLGRRDHTPALNQSDVLWALDSKSEAGMPINRLKKVMRNFRKKLIDFESFFRHNILQSSNCGKI